MTDDPGKPPTSEQAVLAGSAAPDPAAPAVPADSAPGTDTASEPSPAQVLTSENGEVTVEIPEGALISGETATLEPVDPPEGAVGAFRINPGIRTRPAATVRWAVPDATSGHGYGITGEGVTSQDVRYVDFQMEITAQVTGSTTFALDDLRAMVRQIAPDQPIEVGESFNFEVELEVPHGRGEIIWMDETEGYRARGEPSHERDWLRRQCDRARTLVVDAVASASYNIRGEGSEAYDQFAFVPIRLEALCSTEPPSIEVAPEVLALLEVPGVEPYPGRVLLYPDDEAAPGRQVRLEVPDILDVGTVGITFQDESTLVECYLDYREVAADPPPATAPEAGANAGAEPQGVCVTRDAQSGAQISSEAVPWQTSHGTNSVDFLPATVDLFLLPTFGPVGQNAPVIYVLLFTRQGDRYESDIGGWSAAWGD